MKIALLVFILILCLAYSMTIKTNESMEGSPDDEPTGLLRIGAFGTAGVISQQDDAFYCEQIQSYINNKDPTIQSENDDKIKSDGIKINRILDELIQSPVYALVFDDNSKIYTGTKFNCWMDLVRKTLGITDNTMNKNKAVDVLEKIINFLNKIKTKLMPTPIPTPARPTPARPTPARPTPALTTPARTTPARPTLSGGIKL